MSQRVDYMIVGGGLAGACLATHLLNEGSSFAWFDTPKENRASAVAAGLFNPITNKVMNKSWKADVLFESLHKFYRQAEKLTGQHFFHPQLICRPFVSVEEQNTWMVKSGEPRMQRYIHSIFTQSQYGDEIHDPQGGIMVDLGGYLNVHQFLAAVKETARAHQRYYEEPFRYDELTLADGGVGYKNLSAKNIVFCEGTKVRTNPYFGWLPVNSLKGETLEIKTPIALTRLYNRGVYLVPMENGNYKVGATYQHNGVPGASAEGRQELLEKLESLLKLPFQEVSQDWGFRPTIIDRQPVLGPHPQHPQLVVFNALGTKGVSLAPHFSGVLVDWLAGRGQLDKDVNISRFYALYSKF